MKDMNLFGDNTSSKANKEEVKLETTTINGKEVKYDPREFVIREELGKRYLHYIGDGNNVRNPEGNTSCYKMFSYYKGETLDLSDFDTSNVTNMDGMFSNCALPEGFILEDKFDTSNVTYMHEMFERCILPEGFSLGDKFDTSNVTDMSCMFYGCKFPEGFSLGDKFDTSNVTDMYKMFEGCENFEIPDRYHG